jgi:nitrite reductase/ring-hydroxylating ferredoxin subunit
VSAPGVTVAHRVGHVDDFPEGECRIVEVEGQSIGVYRAGGELYALRNVCPHRLAPLCRGIFGGTMLPSDPDEFSYGMEGYVARCPRHGWEFDIRTGEALFGIDGRRARTYPVTVEGQDVLIALRQRRET